MRFMFAKLDRLASHPSEISVLFATMARIARADSDRWARASFVEGVVGYQPGTLARNMSKMDEAEAALDSNQPNPVVDVLLYEKGMSPEDVKALLGRKDRRLPEALLAAVRKVIPTSIRGIDAEDVAQSLIIGISPITMEPFPQYKKTNMFYFLGTKAPNKLTMAGLVRVIQSHAIKKATDVVRGSSEMDQGMSLSSPGSANSESILEDVLSGESSVSRADYIEMAESIFQNPLIMAKLDQAVRAFLHGPAQLAVWEVVRDNPQFIIIKGSDLGEPSVGLENEKATAKLIEMTGEDISPQAVGKMWRSKVWPAMRAAFKDSEVARALLKNRQIMEVIDEETRRRAPTHENIRDIGYKGVRRSLPPGPVLEGFRAAALRVAARWKVSAGHSTYEEYVKDWKALKYPEDVKGKILPKEKWEKLMGKEEASKKDASWNLPPRQRALYNTLRKWALANFERFKSPRGLDTDALAEELASRAGDRLLAEDPTHWVYEIAYDMSRLSPSVAR